MSDIREWSACRAQLVGYREGNWISIDDWLDGKMPDPAWHGEKTGRAKPRSWWLRGHSNVVVDEIDESTYDELLALMDAEGLTWIQAISGAQGRSVLRRVDFPHGAFMVGTVSRLEPRDS